jgi:hypothetical protein
MLAVAFNVFAFVLCLVALVLNAVAGNVGWVVVMAICMAMNAIFAVMNLVNYLN